MSVLSFDCSANFIFSELRLDNCIWLMFAESESNSHNQYSATFIEFNFFHFFTFSASYCNSLFTPSGVCQGLVNVEQKVWFCVYFQFDYFTTFDFHRYVGLFTWYDVIVFRSDGRTLTEMTSAGRFIIATRTEQQKKMPPSRDHGLLWKVNQSPLHAIRTNRIKHHASPPTATDLVETHDCSFFLLLDALRLLLPWESTTLQPRSWFPKASCLCRSARCGLILVSEGPQWKLEPAGGAR